MYWVSIFFIVTGIWYYLSAKLLTKNEKVLIFISIKMPKKYMLLYMGDSSTSMPCYYFAKLNGTSFPTSVFTVFFPYAFSKENRKPSDCQILFALFE